MSTDQHVRDDAPRLDAFFADAVDELEPPSLPTAGQLWWRAELLERLAADERRARRAARPARWGLVLGTLAVLAALALAALELDPRAAPIDAWALALAIALPTLCGILLAFLWRRT